ncbi:hypothetical protein LCGC14_0371510 [marine sediment metagenome]|uniref:Cation-transporting P-type ATPase C-terminal domain-containing protein n=1 Tax=marine sediment metagenome TaxID=412755 RepID=A0A0F9TAX1_9ZZZZ
MDAFIKKRFGILLLIVIGGLALPLGELIVASPIPIMWKWYMGTILTAGLLFGEEYVRHQFKIAKEDVPEKPERSLPALPVLPPH